MRISLRPLYAVALFETIIVRVISPGVACLSVGNLVGVFLTECKGRKPEPISRVNYVTGFGLFCHNVRWMYHLAYRMDAFKLLAI